MAKNYLLESLAWAQVLLDSNMHWNKKPTTSDNNNNNNNKTPRLVYSPMVTPNQPSKPPPPQQRHNLNVASETTSLLVRSSSMPMTDDEENPTTTTPVGSLPGTPTAGRQRLLVTPTSSAPTTSSYAIGHDRKFEVNTLCRVFLGKRGGLQIYTTFICLYCYCTLWAYTSVFSSALAQMWPLPSWRNLLGDTDTDQDVDSYLWYSILFATMVVPLSCLELNEQITVQVIMTLARFVMLFFMLSTAHQVAALDDMTTPRETVPLVQWSGVHQMLPILVFAHIYHHSIPGLAQPVANKRQLRHVFAATTIFSTVAYTLLGLTLASAFGPHVQQSSNLHWNRYYSSSGDTNGGWWHYFVSVYVVCFPALDVISAFPLNAITLGNNMLGAAYGSQIHQVEVREMRSLLVC